jgi:hypothetical protein
MKETIQGIEIPVNFPVSVEDLNAKLAKTRLDCLSFFLDPGKSQPFPGKDKDGVRRLSFRVTNADSLASGLSGALYDSVSGQRMMVLKPGVTCFPIETDHPLEVRNPDSNGTALDFDVIEIFYA